MLNVALQCQQRAWRLPGLDRRDVGGLERVELFVGWQPAPALELG
jgi:hypothetical protein